MAVTTTCQTPGAVFSTEFGDTFVKVRIDLPFLLLLTESEACLLEANLHNAVELVLARYFTPLAR